MGLNDQFLKVNKVCSSDCISKIINSKYNKTLHKQIDNCSQKCEEDFNENIYCQDNASFVKQFCKEICI